MIGKAILRIAFLLHPHEFCTTCNLLQSQHKIIKALALATNRYHRRANWVCSPCPCHAPTGLITPIKGKKRLIEAAYAKTVLVEESAALLHISFGLVHLSFC